ncbi:MAG: hypothetical protein ABEJ26_04835 [Halosimplex sp.]
MDVSTRLRRARLLAPGEDQRQVAFGALATVALFAVAVRVDGFQQIVGMTGLTVAAAAGALTGLALGCG